MFKVKHWLGLSKVLLPAAVFAALLGSVVAIVTSEIAGRAAPSTGEVALRQIDVWANFEASEGLSPELADELRTIPEVESVEGLVRSSIYAAGSTPGTFNMTAVSFRPTNPPPEIVWAPTIPEDERFSDGDILVPAVTQGTDFEALLGEEIDIGYTRMITPGEGVGEETKARIIGVYDPDYEADGFATAYGSTETIEAFRSDEKAGAEGYLPGYEMLTVTVESQEDVALVAQVLRNMELDITVIEERTGDLSQRISAFEVTALFAGLALLMAEVLLVVQGARLLVSGRMKSFALRLASGAGAVSVAKSAFRELVVPFVAVGAAGTIVGSSIAWFSWPSMENWPIIGLAVAATTILLAAAIALSASSASRRLITADLVSTLNGE